MLSVALLGTSHIMQQGVRAMVAALFFWALAIYGALTLVWQSVQRLRGKQHPHPVKLILIVQNAAGEIEGVLRTLLIQGSIGTREHRIVVLDLASTDDTEGIVRKLAARNGCIDYLKIRNEGDVSLYLSQALLDSSTIGCIYDLRIPEMVRELSKDAAWLCQ